MSFIDTKNTPMFRGTWYVLGASGLGLLEIGIEKVPAQAKVPNVSQLMNFGYKPHHSLFDLHISL